MPIYIYIYECIYQLSSVVVVRTRISNTDFQSIPTQFSWNIVTSFIFPFDLVPNLIHSFTYLFVYVFSIEFKYANFLFVLVFVSLFFCFVFVSVGGFRVFLEGIVFYLYVVVVVVVVVVYCMFLWVNHSNSCIRDCVSKSVTPFCPCLCVFKENFPCSVIFFFFTPRH